mmetsp:Transcript_30533/g.62984  ORF Transcript_30533/g.62984 Transcript_30533/m.62984 type:complete len:85 (+) Transcript_30533:428-682(+)
MFQQNAYGVSLLLRGKGLSFLLIRVSYLRLPLCCHQLGLWFWCGECKFCGCFLFLRHVTAFRWKLLFSRSREKRRSVEEWKAFG